MSNITMKDITIPSLNNTYTFAQVDNTLAVTGAAADAKKTGDEISALKQDLTNLQNTMVTDTASGSIASFTDGADGVPMKSVIVNIEPVQSGSGDPSPTNIRPISGWTSVDTTVCGVNVWDEEWELGGISETTGANDTVTDLIRSKNYISVVPSTTYYCSYGNADKVYECFFYDANKDYLGYSVASNGIVTTPANCAFMRFRCRAAYGTTYNNDISINYPSTDTSYHAHNTDSQTVTTQLGQTVYGGTLDVVSGVLTIDRATYTLDGDETISTGNYGMPFMTYLPNNIKLSTDISVLTGTLCNQLTEVTQSSTWGTNGTFSRTKSDKAIFFKLDDTITTVEALRTYLASNPFQFVYELATPTTVQLTAQEVDSLLGDNNVYADAGDVSVTYKADTKLYIQKVLNA